MQPLSVREEVDEGQVLWVLEGILAEGERSAVWIDPATFFVRRARFQTARSVVTLKVVTIDGEAKIAAELFQPPSAEELARLFGASPEGMTILAQVIRRYMRAPSFFLRKRMVSATTEVWVYWQPPYLRLEVRTPPSPWFGSQLLLVQIFDLQGGRLYFYFADKEQWCVEDLFEGESLNVSAEVALAVALGGLSYSLIVRVEEVTLESRPAWRVTGKPLFLGDPKAPLSQWWVDKETLQVIQYTLPVRLSKDRRSSTQEWTWEVRTVRVFDFKEDMEFPPELFALPEAATPLSPRALPLDTDREPELPPEKLAPTAPALSWEPFSPAKLEEALSTSPVVVLYFSADWCLPCHALEDEAFRAPAVIELLSPYPRLKVDLDQDPGARQVANVYRVRAVPTLLFLDALGKEIGRITGYSGVALLRAEILKILQEVKK